MNKDYQVKKLPVDFNFDTVSILKKLAEAKASISELKGFANVIPNQSMLVHTLSLQEAKDSSEIENIITTHDQLFKAEIDAELVKDISAKEVQNYSRALLEGFEMVRKDGSITNNTILAIQRRLEQNDAGYRKLIGTNLKNLQTGKMVYEPPQHIDSINELMSDLIDYINDSSRDNLDPLIKMGIIHHQFESIHPFYDGNGRTGRIINILYLILQGQLDIPILYLSRFIIQNKNLYYELLQNVRDSNSWEPWIIYMLEGINLTAKDTILLIEEIRILIQEYKLFIRDNFNFYSQDLLNALFKYPYTNISFIVKELGITRQTASKYLNQLSNSNNGLFDHIKLGKHSYFINVKLFKLLLRERDVKLKV